MMSKKNLFQGSTGKYKDYLRPTTKSLSSETYYYKEKEWSLQEQIHHKLKRVANFLENVYPKLTDDFTHNIKNVIEENLKVLFKDLELMEKSLKHDPLAFNTKKLALNQHHIDEMKHVCDTLQSVKSYEYEVGHLDRIKHALHELEHLIQHPDFATKPKQVRTKSKLKILGDKKETPSVRVEKKVKKSIAATSKKPKAVSKKAKKPTTVRVKVTTKSKPTKKTKAPVSILKPAVKKIAAKKPAVKKTAVKKPAVKKIAAKKPSVKKTAVKKPVAKKRVVKKVK